MTAIVRPTGGSMTARDWQRSAAAWDAAARAWLDGARSEHTRRAYETAVQQFVCWKLFPALWREKAGNRGKAGSVPAFPVSRVEPWTLTVSDVESYKRAMLRAGLSSATVNSRLAALSALFEYARTRCVRMMGDGPVALCALNPVAGVDRPSAPPRKRTVLSPEQIRALIHNQVPSNAVGARNRALLVLLLFTGLRNSEARKLRWGDIRVDDDGEVYIYWTGKNEKGGEKQVRRVVYAAIVQYLQVAGRKGITDDEYLFTPLSADAARFAHVDAARMDRPISRQRVNQIVKASARDAGLRDDLITTHTLRRTAATLFYEQSGSDIELTRQMLGHSRVETTSRYIFVQPEDENEVWQSVEALLGLA